MHSIVNIDGASPVYRDKRQVGEIKTRRVLQRGLLSGSLH